MSEWLTKALSKVADSVTGVLHVGAHTAQEADVYQSAGITNVVWVEANPRLIPKLSDIAKARGQRVIAAAVWDKCEVRTMRISNNEGSSSSLLEFGTHRDRHPHVHWVDAIEVETTTLDDLATHYDLRGINMLAMDIQGAEAHALAGGGKFLRQIDFVLTEINFERVYLGCGLVESLERYLKDFTCAAAQLYHNNGQMFAGDAFYVRLKMSAMDYLGR